MIAKGLERRGRNRVHRVSPDQFLDIADVAVPRILGAGARPQETLRMRALGGQSLPSRRAAEFKVALVRELGVGNRHVPKKARQ